MAQTPVLLARIGEVLALKYAVDPDKLNFFVAFHGTFDKSWNSPELEDLLFFYIIFNSLFAVTPIFPPCLQINGQ